MLVVGTAGHIDHGKSSIVKRLTGTDPDRLPEEKARGMTIDLGFAFYNLDSESQIAFVDVPGHERFVKNMIAGAGGIDVVMLVIAADDGWMPQSQEHFQVVRLLGVKHGLIVINKSDLVEPDWLDLLKTEVAEKVHGSFLENAPIFTVSAQSGDGFDSLSGYLKTLPGKVEAQRDIDKARLYIDRSFVQQGIGGVVTGTLKRGKLSVGQTVSIWPSRDKGKIRSLQSNNIDVEIAHPGQRTAVSLTGIDRDQLIRGGVLSYYDDLSILTENPILVLSMEMLPEAVLSLTDRRKILLIVGTTEVTGELRMYNKAELKPGEKGILFFKPDEPVYAVVGDHFISRLPTPMVTLGGGMIIDRLNAFPRRRYLDKYNYLNLRLSGSIADLLISEISKLTLVPSDEVLRFSNYSTTDLKKQIKALEKENQISSFKGYLYCQDIINLKSKEISVAITDFLEKKSHLRGLLIDELIRVVGLAEKTALILIKLLEANGILVKIGDRYALSGRDTSLKGATKQAYEKIMTLLDKSGMTPPTLTALAKEGKAFKEAIGFIIESGLGYKCGSEFIFLFSDWQKITGFVRERIQQNGEITVADLKDHFELTRKYVIPILEETDRIQLTRRDGDTRVKGARFEIEASDI